MRKEFKATSPELILIILDNKKSVYLETVFQKGLDQLEKSYVALSLYIPPRDLKKALTIIKLMDVKGLFITGKHQKEGRHFADIVDDKKLTNAVVLKKNLYHGYNIPPASSKKATDLVEMTAAGVKLWTRKNIDKGKLTKQIKHLIPKV